MKYTFSENTVAEFYGRQFYSITNELGELCAYSERIFEIEKEVVLHPGKTLIFEEAVLIKGEMRGGVMWGGVMRGGVMHGGEMWGGVIEVSMLQIQGTRHFCYASPTKTGESIWLGIGCEFHPIEWWIENFESVGKSEGYTTEQIAEYKLYIDLFALRYPSQNTNQ